MSFQKATKHRVKLRAGLFGPSGSGKTYSALRIAKGLGGSVAVIDTEHKRASLYADDFDFVVNDLEDHSIEAYTNAISDAIKEKVDVLIIDSASHEWIWVLDQVEKTAQTKFRGNSWSAWSVWTPKHREFLEAILHYPGHIISTFRVDTEWLQETDTKSGKTRPVKVGLKPQTGKGIEYDFDFVLELNPEHFATITKGPRQFQDRIIEKPSEEFGAELASWLADGAAKQEDDTPPDLKGQTRPELVELAGLISTHKINDVQIAAWCNHFSVKALHELTAEQVTKISNKLKKEAAKSAA